MLVQNAERSSSSKGTGAGAVQGWNTVCKASQPVLDPGPEHLGNGYTAGGVPRVPHSLYEAARLLAGSQMAREAFGDDVVQHYVNCAEQEQAAYDAIVTCWERERYLERG